MTSDPASVPFIRSARMAFAHSSARGERIGRASGVLEDLMIGNAMHNTAGVLATDNEPGLHEDDRHRLDQRALLIKSAYACSHLTRALGRR